MIPGNGNGNGNGHHPNGNGNGNGHKLLVPEDRFAAIDLEKPRLFISREEVIKKTGILRNFLFTFFILIAFGFAGLLPLSSSVTDPDAVVAPVRRTDLASPKDGFITQVFFKEGEEVKRGDLLLKVESKQEKAACRQARLEALALAKAISRERAEARILVLKLAEAGRLKAMGSLKDQAFEEARLLLEAKQAGIESLKFRVLQARERVIFLNSILREGAIRAPFDGRVISDTQLKEKAFVKQGDFLVTLASRDSAVEFLLKETDYSRVALGRRARIRFYAFPGKSWEGRVVGFKPFAQALPKSGITRHAVKVLIRYEKTSFSIQNGMSAKVTLEAAPQSFLRRICGELL